MRRFQLDIEALRTAVKSSGLKQKYLAEQIGVSEKTFSYMLAGKTKFPADVFCSLCIALNKQMDSFCKTDLTQSSA